MNSQIVLLLAVLLIAALGVGAYFVRRASKKEHFTVLYPSDIKLKQSWDRSAVLTAVMRDGKLR
jgi:hypothetical protein